MGRKNLEDIKRDSTALHKPLTSELKNDSTHFTEAGRQVLKFHGIYQQVDRDTRRERKRTGEEPDYQFMVRSKLPGGYLTAEQYLTHDKLASLYANGTLRVTTRQGFQFHGVLKDGLKGTLRRLNDELVTTLGACGDNARNVMCCPAPTGDTVRTEIFKTAQAISDTLTARTNAYHKIWLNGERIEFDNGSGEEPAEDPIYGKTYLPRKFKVGVTYPGDNCVDIFTHDLGFVAVPADDGSVAGYTVLVGGGLGRTHKKPETFPRLSDPMAFVQPDQAVEVAVAVVKAFRDHGNRENRRRARLKYLIHEKGLDWFREQVEGYLGWTLEPPRDLPDFETHDHLGWHEQADGRLWYGLWVENGRIKDDGDYKLRSALRALVERFRPNLRLTPQHNVLLTDIDPADRVLVDALLREYNIITVGDLTNVRRHEMACPALPTCGLAITESERVAPAVIGQLETRLSVLGMPDADVNVRMTGCPNACSRPYVAEIAFVGRSLDKYVVYIGGDFHGRRLNEAYADLVHRDDLIDTITPLLAYWRDYARDGERFGDFAHRVGIEELRAFADEFEPADLTSVPVPVS